MRRSVSALLLAFFASCAQGWGCDPPRSPSGGIEGDVLQPLKGPYAAPPRRSFCGAPVALTTLPTFPAPAKDVIGASYYVDAKRSIIDPELKAENERLQAPLKDFGRSLMELSDGYLRSDPPNPRLAAATLDGLYQWASAGALLGQANRQGFYHLTWALVVCALDYLKIRDASGLEPARRATVELWLRRLAGRIKWYFEQNPQGRDHQNNLLYWAALAVAAAGAASGDKTMFDWGVAQYSTFVRLLAPDGTLPSEMARGSRALHYHLFSVAPLVMLAEIAAANGVDLYARGDRALDRLIARCLAGVSDPSAFAVAAGAEQVDLDPSDLAWLEPYYARFPREELLRWMKSRPFVSEHLGGDLTLAFGVPLPATPPAP